jgi:diaminohydroxyphosphoribosylaminopyrimidine deaminase/5-amino-6-(5-phosphoribosylamino)uracil reductase
VLGNRLVKTIIATTQTTNPATFNSIKDLVKNFIKIMSNNGQVDLKALMKEIGKIGITGIMIEGGSSIAASSISAKIVNKVNFFIAPKIIGGKDSFSSVGGSSQKSLINAIKQKAMKTKKFGDDILVEGYI